MKTCTTKKTWVKDSHKKTKKVIGGNLMVQNGIMIGGWRS